MGLEPGHGISVAPPGDSSLDPGCPDPALLRASLRERRGGQAHNLNREGSDGVIRNGALITALTTRHNLTHALQIGFCSAVARGPQRGLHVSKASTAKMIAPRADIQMPDTKSSRRG